MIAQVIAAIIGNYMLSCFVLGLVVAGVRVSRLPTPRSSAEVSGVFLNGFVLFATGVALVINFVMHSVFGDFAARSIGWAQSPFQLELALMSLGVGVMAIIVHGGRSQLRAKAAVVIASVIFGWGAAAGHIYQLLVNHDHAVNNTGLLLVGDVLIQAVGLGLLLWHAVARRHEPLCTTDATVVTADEAAALAVAEIDARTTVQRA
jgi:hypothetical protein